MHGKTGKIPHLKGDGLNRSGPYYQPMGLRALMVCLTILLATAFAQPEAGAQRLFLKGNEAYRSGHYQEAVKLYRQILDAGLESPEVYYNLGNCYYKLNRLGLAILYYRKAKRLNPSDRDVAFNLQLARARVIDRVTLPPQFVLLAWWHRLVRRYSVDQLAWWLTVAFAFTVTALGIRLLVTRWSLRRLFSWLGTAGATAFLVIGLLFWATWKTQAGQQEGVVLSSAVTVQSAPDEQSTQLFVLHEGTEVIVEESRGNWSRIRLLDGKEGWVPNSSLGLI